MFSGLKWLRLVPDRPGRGGQKTGIHTFQQQPLNDLRFLFNAHVYQGAWRRDYTSMPYPVPQSWDVAGNHNQIGALHGYVYPSLTDPAAQPSVSVLGQLYGSTDSHFWDFSHGTIRSTRPVGGIYKQAAVFRNINQRCFAGDGLAEAVIMDDRTPAIHAQANQNLGIGTPTQTLSGAYPGGVYSYGTGYCYNGSFYVTHPNPDNRIGTILATDTVSFSLPNVSYGQYSGVAIVQASPLADAVTSNTTPFSATGTIRITQGTSLVTLLGGGTWPAGFGYCGLTINFNGYSFVIAEHGTQATAYDINGTATALTDTQLLILGIYDGPTIAAPGVPYTITGCRFEMPNAPAAPSTLKVLNTGTLGYSQTTQSNLVQVQILDLQASGFYRNLGNISLGPSAADSAAGGLNTINDASMEDGKRSVISVSLPFTSSDVGKPFFVDGAGPSGGVLSSTVLEFFSDSLVRLEDPNISGANISGGQAWWGTDALVSDGAITIATQTLTSASNPFKVGDIGQAIVVEGAGVGGKALITTISGYTNAGTVTLTAAAGATVTGSRVWWRGISAATHAGPTYAYAWYDPETGHMSNISPLYQIPVPTQIGNLTDFANITPVFRVDPGYISYPSGVDAARFSHIMFFRTLSEPGASTLYPIGSLMPYVGKVHPGQNSTRGSWNPSTYHGWMGLPGNCGDAPPQTPANQNVWYDWSSDSDLLLAGGFRAPQYTNSKPMVLLRGGATQPGYPYQLAYWDRRTWIVNTQEPDKIAFSCDEAQCPLGVPEESFPATNYLRLPAEDGRVMGMRTIGDMLLITTERFAYIVAGNNESNYRLVKASSSMPGVGTYQMDEFPTQAGTQGEPTTMFFLGRDRVVYVWTMGGPVVPVSQPVQNILDTILGPGGFNVYQLSRVHCLSAFGRRLVVVYPYMAAAAQFLVYDVDNQIWNTSSPTDGTGGISFGGTIVFAGVYGLDPPVNELYALKSTAINQVIVRSWVRDDAATSPGSTTLQTFPLTFDVKKTLKEIVAVNLHADDGPWELVTRVNESATFTMTNNFGAYPDPLDSIYGPAPSPVDSATATDTVVIAAQFDSGGIPIIGYRFEFWVQRRDTAPGKIYAIDICYKDAQEPDEGDA